MNAKNIVRPSSYRRDISIQMEAQTLQVDKLLPSCLHFHNWRRKCSADNVITSWRHIGSFGVCCFHRASNIRALIDCFFHPQFLGLRTWFPWIPTVCLIPTSRWSSSRVRTTWKWRPRPSRPPSTPSGMRLSLGMISEYFFSFCIIIYVLSCTYILVFSVYSY